MSKSRAEYMRDYRQKKREEKLRTGQVKPKKIARTSTERSRDLRARERAAKSILSQASTADPTIALPNQALPSQASLQLPSSLTIFPTSTSTAIACDTGPTEIHQCPAGIEQESVVGEEVEHVINSTVQYQDYQKFITAHDDFKTRFLGNNLGAVCNVCNRLQYENNMRSIPLRARELISAEFPDLNFETARICSVCHLALIKNIIPMLSKSDGFKYPSRLPVLPELNLISERLVSPRLPFATIRRLQNGNDSQSQAVVVKLDPEDRSKTDIETSRSTDQEECVLATMDSQAIKVEPDVTALLYEGHTIKEEIDVVISPTELVRPCTSFTDSQVVPIEFEPVDDTALHEGHTIKKELDLDISPTELEKPCTSIKNLQTAAIKVEPADDTALHEGNTIKKEIDLDISPSGSEKPCKNKFGKSTKKNAVIHNKNCYCYNPNKDELTNKTCSICSQEFRFIRGLVSHMYTHISSIYTCDRCNKNYTGKNSMSQHFRRRHEPINYYCDKCDEIFQRRLLLNDHIKLYHKKHTIDCVRCGMKFKRKDCYIVHLGAVCSNSVISVTDVTKKIKPKDSKKKKK